MKIGIIYGYHKYPPKSGGDVHFYQLIKNKQFELAARTGLNGVYEVKSPDDVIELEGLIGFNLLWNLTDKNSIKFNNIFYPALTDVGEYRNVTAFEWAHKLDYYKGMAIKLGFDNAVGAQLSKNNHFIGLFHYFMF